MVSMNKLIVRIKGSSQKSYWYADKIDQIFNVFDNAGAYYVVDRPKETYNGNGIDKVDCEIVGQPPIEFDPSAASDNINSPNHYKSDANFECIDVIAEVTKDLSGMEAVCTANAIKYLYRWKKKKNGLEDLKKTRVYLNWLIERVEKNEKS